jgi:hypothetical protein
MNAEPVTYSNFLVSMAPVAARDARRARPSRRNDGVIHAARGERGLDVIRFEVGVLAKNFRMAHPGRQQIKNIADPEAQAWFFR